jgi:hypothetical protein
MKTNSTLLKITIISLLANFALGLVYSQAPNSFKFQSILRSADGSAIVKQNVSVRISILKDFNTGNPVYTETQSTSSNDFGIINLNIGEGEVQSGSFSSIDWSAGSYFTKIEIDENGGTNYSLSGTNQLLSVPFAIYANKAGNVPNDYVKKSYVDSLFNAPEPTIDFGYSLIYTEDSTFVYVLATDASSNIPSVYEDVAINYPYYSIQWVCNNNEKFGKYVEFNTIIHNGEYSVTERLTINTGNSASSKTYSKTKSFSIKLK